MLAGECECVVSARGSRISNISPEYRCRGACKARLVHRQNFALAEAEATVKELSVDSGNIRIRTPEGEPCGWKGYKAVCLHEQGAVAASFQDNAVVIDWVNTQPHSSSTHLYWGWTRWHLEHYHSIRPNHRAAGGIGLVSPDGKRGPR